jgi:predicted permease
MFGQASCIGNLGFLALPLLLSIVGKVAAVPFANALIVDMVIFIPVSISLLEASGGGSFFQALKRSLRGAVINPFFLAIFAAIILSATGIGLPGLSKSFAEFLAGAAGPAALFSLGVSLASRRIAGGMAPIAVLTFLKLAVHPLVVWGIMSLFGINQQLMLIAIALAAMPVAGNLFVIAEQYGAMVQRLSAAILVSTALAIVTVAMVLSWTGLGG